MRAAIAWIDKVKDKDVSNQCVNDIAFKPDGTELLVAHSNRILVYDPNDGVLQQGLKGHKDSIYCVDYSFNGERFASGSADKSVIIWTAQHEGILKYSHNDSVQALSFNPNQNILVSCAITDFGLWDVNQKSVNKHKTVSRICCCDWSRDGNVFALGLFNGTISVRLKSGEEKCKIDKGHGLPVWALKFNPNKPEDFGSSDGDMYSDVIAVTDWNQTVSYYTYDGQQVGKDRPLEFDPCTIDYFTLGDYIVIGGSDTQLGLYTRDGIRLGSICEQESWVWVARAKPKSQFVVVGCVDGTVACYQLMFSTVHGLYKDRYAFRDSMTDVIIQHLLTDKKVRIRCKDLVKKVAIYKTKLAVQLTKCINIYGITNSNEPDNMNYKLLNSIVKVLECSLLVVTYDNIILCQETRLQCYDFKGYKQREWVMDALIRYIKVVGGVAGRECLLVGLKNGAVYKIFVDNPFPVEMIRIKSAVRCLDMSVHRRKLAVVDEHNACQVFDLKSKELVYQEPNANSVAWNTQCEDLLCFSGNGVLCIKACDFPLYHQTLQGFVVGFTGSKVFCLHLYSMTAIEVPLSNQLYQFIERGLFKDGYNVACLHVPENDWDLLASEALISLDFEVAKKAFIRTRNLKYLELISAIEDRKKRGTNKADLFLAEINAYQGNHSQAAALFKEAGEEQMAMDMYTDLRLFEKAQELMNQTGGAVKTNLIRMRAEWAQSNNDPKMAIEMYMSAGDYMRALTIATTNKWSDIVIEISKKLDRSERDLLMTCSEFLVKSGDIRDAAAIYTKLGDIAGLIQMYINVDMWDEAFKAAEENPQYRDQVYLPYAHWLAEHDRFEEAQKAFHRAGHEMQALHVLTQLTENAVSETRYNDAGYYYWMLSMQYLERASEKVDEAQKCLEKFREYQQLANIYYAYNAVYRYTEDPFTSYTPDALLNISRYLINNLSPTKTPHGVSRVSVLYTLAKQSRTLGAFKLAKHCYEKLQQLRIPPRFQNAIDVGCLTVRAKPFTDAEELSPMCYRCKTNNPMLHPKGGNSCVRCKQPFIFSFISFEILPLVEFVVDSSIPDSEAKELIEAEPPLEPSSDKDPFSDKAPVQVDTFEPIVLNRSHLLSLHRTEVIVCEWPAPLKNKYYRNLIPEVSITRCSSCNRLFHTDDYEMQVLQEGHCPMCHKEDARIKTKPVDFEDESDN